jgi:peptidoglycan/xylan/chitin deacetylase (PgdA/CDA1 family)
MKTILKKYLVTILSVSLFLTPLLPIMASAQSSNLIANSNFETSTASMPDNWVPESWGSNTSSFTYTKNAHTGNYAAQTTVSNYSNGDAKWIPDAVSTTSGNNYSYTDWYESTVTTNIWARYTGTDGTYSYQWIGTVGASPLWNKTSESITIPTGVVAVSIFHVLNANGQLTIDDTSLLSVMNCVVSEANGVNNGGFEQTCPSDTTTPANWQTETYGSPGASFAYTTSARTGSRAVQTTVTSNGEAGWQTNAQAVASNQRYNLSFWQNGTAYVYAYVEVTLTDGSLQYTSLMSVPATQNTGWSQYSDNFITPNNTASIKITIATSAVGTFTLDDVYLNTLINQTPTMFSNGVVSLTFDDGDASAYSNGFPTLKANNFKGTFYINAGMLGSSGYMTTNNVKTLFTDGNEIGSHLYKHIDMVPLSTLDLKSQITTNNSALTSILGTSSAVTDFASPYGSYTSNGLSTVMQYYQSHRDTDGEMNTKANLNAQHIHAILVTSTTTPDQIKSWVSQAQTNNEWLVLVYHSIGSAPVNGDGAGYATTPAHFTTEMTNLKTSNIRVAPINTALSLLLPQL